MSTVAEIIAAVKKLPVEQKSEFLEELREIDFEDAPELRTTRSAP